MSVRHETAPGAQASPRKRSLLVLVGAVLGCAVTARLCMWQLSRADQKIALRDAIEAQARAPVLGQAELARDEPSGAAQLWRPVRLQGRWLSERSVWLDNRQMDGRPGFYVLTPLLLAPGDAIVVQRGWVPRNVEDRTVRPPLPAADGMVEVIGRIAPAPGRLYDFGGEEQGPIRQNLDLVAYSRELGMRLRPVTVQQLEDPASAGTAPDGLRRDWPQPVVDVSKHYGYAFQWGALCALIAGLYVWFQVVRPRLRRTAG